MTHAETAFLQLFLLKKFKTFGPKLVQYDIVKMVEVEENNEPVMRPDRPCKMRVKDGWLEAN